MSGLLIGIALLLMFVSALVASNSRGADVGGKEAAANDPKPNFLHKALGVGGIIIALGGFWIDWMLWLGLISIELGCIAYFVGNSRQREE
jgi:hypothetical protein